MEEMAEIPKLIAFDLDGTLAASKQPMTSEMGALLARLLKVAKVAVMSGADAPQFKEQFLPGLPKDAAFENLYLFPTSGAECLIYHGGEWTRSYDNELTPEEKKKILAELDTALAAAGLTEPPEKVWGERIEDRGEQISFSALGQKAPVEEKQKWHDAYDGKRQELRATLAGLLPDFSVRAGGLTTVDITKKGVSKAYALGRLADISSVAIADMLYVGDALFPGGNDAVVTEAGVPVRAVAGPEESAELIRSYLPPEPKPEPPKKPAPPPAPPKPVEHLENIIPLLKEKELMPPSPATVSRSSSATVLQSKIEADKPKAPPAPAPLHDASTPPPVSSKPMETSIPTVMWYFLLLVGILIVLAGGYLFFVGGPAPAPAGGGTTTQNGAGAATTTASSTAPANNLISVSAPLPDTVVSSPLTVGGQARGTWYFEASFPVILKDANGTVLAQVPAQAQSDWMTTDFVPFSATLTFTAPTTETGVLIFKNDNPSGDPARDMQIEVPVRFAPAS